MKGIHYEHIASAYDALYSEEQLEKLEPILKIIDLPKDALLLDIGCGTGISSSVFNCRRIGIDNSFEMLSASKEKSLQKICGIAEKLPFKGKSFDFVICLTAIHNFSDPELALEEMKRVSRGKIAVSVMKRSKKFKIISDFIKTEFRIDAIFDTPKDTIFLL